MSEQNTGVCTKGLNAKGLNAKGLIKKGIEGLISKVIITKLQKT